MRRYNCNCDASAGAPDHARTCPEHRDFGKINVKDFGASKPAVIARNYIQPSEWPTWECPVWSAQQEAFKELLRQAQQDSDEMREACLLKALGMTREEAVANRHRITRHCHPGQDVFLLDGEPVIAIHKPVFRGDEMVTSFQILRKPT